MGSLISVLLAVSILLSLFYTCRVFRLDEDSKLGWLIVVADAAVLVSLVSLVSRWDIAGQRYRRGLDQSPLRPDRISDLSLAAARHGRCKSGPAGERPPATRGGRNSAKVYCPSAPPSAIAQGNRLS